MSLRCSKCGNVALGFASEGDRCFSGKGRNRCNGLLLAFEDAPQKKPVEVPAPTVPEQPAVPVLVEVESHALPEANGYHDVDELVDAAPVSLDGPLADRRAAVKLARQVMEEVAAAGLHDGPLVTELVPEAPFWPAEPEHHDYFARNPWSGYCRAVVAPKVLKFRKAFADRLKKA